jgi:succinyl-CoA synthetase beta subunit
MQLREYQGKQLFTTYGIPVPPSTLLNPGDPVPDTFPFSPIVVKAQVLQGKRQKHGLITLPPPGTEQEAIRTLREKTDAPVLLEKRLDVEQEHYLSFSVNRATRGYTVLYSEKGGIDIEQVTAEHITQHALLEKSGLADADLPSAVNNAAEKLFNLFVEEDCLLAEVNPLIQTPDGFVAADSKVILDDNAAFRHEDRDVTDTADRTPLEEEAHEDGLQFVELDGDVGVIGNGAGLVLATLDMIDHYGTSPANFLDIGGGADEESMEAALDLVLEQEPHPRGVFINIFGGITHCDQIAHGIVDYLDDHPVDVPVVVRMIGTNQEQGRHILEENGIHALESMEEAAEKITALTQEKDGGTGNG